MPDQAKAFAASQTRENLMRAFAGESQARSRYTIAAGIAHKSGLAVIQGLFLFTAEQEKTHAKQFYRQLHDLSGQTVRVDGTYPVDLVHRSAGLSPGRPAQRVSGVGTRLRRLRPYRHGGGLPPGGQAV